ncbi:MAG: hypothetical protein NVSMB26_04060 [Beijerinckiaceae bacterium]
MIRILSLAAVPAMLLGMAGLNESGFCFARFERVPDDELIDIAIAANLQLHSSGSERSKVYAAPADVKRQNPGCCSLRRNQNPYGELPAPIMSAFGFKMNEAALLYKINERPKDDFYLSYTLIDACGKIRGGYGTRQSGSKLFE